MFKIVSIFFGNSFLTLTRSQLPLPRRGVRRAVTGGAQQAASPLSTSASRCCRWHLRNLLPTSLLALPSLLVCLPLSCLLVCIPIYFPYCETNTWILSWRVSVCLQKKGLWMAHLTVFTAIFQTLEIVSFHFFTFCNLPVLLRKLGEGHPYAWKRCNEGQQDSCKDLGSTLMKSEAKN